MNEELKKLEEWTIIHIKNRDLIKRELKDYKILDSAIKVNYKSKSQTIYLYQIMDSTIINKIGEELITVVCLNSMKNINFCVDNWDKLISNKLFSIIFVNPESKNKWIIYPYTHNKITEKASLKSGLVSLYENVEN